MKVKNSGQGNKKTGANLSKTASYKYLIFRLKK